jgi:transposase
MYAAASSILARHETAAPNVLRRFNAVFRRLGEVSESTSETEAGEVLAPRIARRGVAHGSGLGRQRWVVERGFAWLHAFKRLRTRYERRADLHLGLLQLACSLICYRHLTVVLE